MSSCSDKESAPVEQNTGEVPADREGNAPLSSENEIDVLVLGRRRHREVAKAKSDMISKLDRQEVFAERWRGTEETKAEDHMQLDAEEEQPEALELIDCSEATEYHQGTMTRRLSMKTRRRKHERHEVGADFRQDSWQQNEERTCNPSRVCGRI